MHGKSIWHILYIISHINNYHGAAAMKISCHQSMAAYHINGIYLINDSLI